MLPFHPNFRSYLESHHPGAVTGIFQRHHGLDYCDDGVSIVENRRKVANVLAAKFRSMSLVRVTDVFPVNCEV